MAGVLPPAYQAGAQCEDDLTNPCRWNEDLFFDGVRLGRAPTRTAVTANSYYADYSQNIVILGRNPSGHQLDLATTSTAIGSSEPDVTVRDVTVQQFANPAQSGAVSVGGDNWKVIDSDLRQNHGAGAYVYGAHDTVAYDRLDDNGQEGGADHGSFGEVVTGDEIAGNNTDGFWMADWEAGGWKSGSSRNLGFSRNAVLANRGVGLWFDLQCKGVMVEANVISNNDSGGIRFELSSGGYIAGNRIDGNGLGRGRAWGGQLEYGGSIAVTGSQDVVVTQNDLAGNSNGIAAIAEPRDGVGSDQTLSSVSVISNRTELSRGQAGLVSLRGSNPVRGVDFRANSYSLPSDGERYFVWGDQTFTLAGWRAFGED